MGRSRLIGPSPPHYRCHQERGVLTVFTHVKGSGLSVVYVFAATGVDHFGDPQGGHALGETYIFVIHLRRPWYRPSRAAEP